MTVLVTGATGHVGAQIVKLLAPHREVRALVRRVDRATALPDGIDVAVGDFADPPSLATAMSGVERMFMVCLSEAAPTRLVNHRHVVEAAARAGVDHLVYLSFLAASPHSRIPQGRWHADTESAIDAVGLSRTFLRAGLYQSSLSTTAGVIDGDRLLAPAGAGRIAPVAREDIAAVAAAVLVQDDPPTATYDVTGPDLLDWHGVAEAVTHATGHRLTYEPVDDAAFASRLRVRGAPPALVDGMVTMFADIRDGVLAIRTETVERLTGIRALSVSRTASTTSTRVSGRRG